jgi:hypothetical protein
MNPRIHMSSDPSVPNVTTIARLHAALDGVEALESLFSDIVVPITAAKSARRIGMLTGEIRNILVGLLKPTLAA